MHFGNHTNPEILSLLSSGQLSYGDTVYSTSWNEQLVFDGTVFKSTCNCNELGTRPKCEDNNTCPSIIEAYATFDSEFDPGWNP